MLRCCFCRFGGACGMAGGIWDRSGIPGQTVNPLRRYESAEPR